MHSPLVSVIIPAYNAEKTIRETVLSVLDQKFSNFEVVIIDDGSTDSTLRVLNELKDSRIRVFSYENAGVAVSRNRGITHSTGEFIAFLDSDDLWSREKLSSQLDALRTSKADVAYSWTYIMEEDEGGRVLRPCNPSRARGNVYKDLLVGDFIYTASNVLIRRSLINSVGGFDTDLSSCEDWEYWVRLASQCEFELVPEYQIFYRRTPGSLSTKVEIMKESSLAAIEKVFQAAPASLQYYKSQCLVNHSLYCADLYLRCVGDTRSIDNAAVELRRALLMKPALFLNPGVLKKLCKFCMAKFFPKNLFFLKRLSRCSVKRHHESS